MRRLAIIACLAAPLTAAAAPPALAAQERAPLQARLVTCQAGADDRDARRRLHRADARGRRDDADVDALRPPAAHAGRGRVRAGEAARVGRLAALRARARRRSSTPSASRACAPPAPTARGYRFRWYDADGRLQRTATRTTRTCRQPDPRPNLTAGDVTVAGGLGAGTATYLLDVGNEGRGAAEPFAVALAVAGVPQPPVTVDGLAAGRPDGRERRPARAARRGRRCVRARSGRPPSRSPTSPTTSSTARARPAASDPSRASRTPCNAADRR